ncbi:substrate-binding domain-containing protein [Kocuria turfanensis]|uniref:substrate-binding domain-containing protein n=1 Tax=Kocuria turfanensis TaxID=388357 RepID=UPI004036B917
MRNDDVRIGLVIPLQGSTGIFGPSCEAVADTAVREINAEGLLGRRVVLEVVDGGAPVPEITARVGRLLERGAIDALTGWHISAVREALAPLTAGRIPYAYTSLYEGGERRPGVFCTGETPEHQVGPALRWLRDRRGAHRWFIVGDDYVWPRVSARVTERFAHELDLELVGAAFVPLGTGDFSGTLDAVARSGADGVLLYLVGQDAVQFHRMFAARGLDDRLLRYTPLMEENMLLASGCEATRDLFVSASYFRSLATASALQLCTSYVADHGPDAPPLNEMAESCYEGLLMLRALAHRAGSFEVPRLMAAAQGFGYDGPRGAMTMARHRTDQPIHLAVPDGFDFEVIETLCRGGPPKP